MRTRGARKRVLRVRVGKRRHVEPWHISAAMQGAAKLLMADGTYKQWGDLDCYNRENSNFFMVVFCWYCTVLCNLQAIYLNVFECLGHHRCSP